MSCFSASFRLWNSSWKPKKVKHSILTRLRQCLKKLQISLLAAAQVLLLKNHDSTVLVNNLYKSFKMYSTNINFCVFIFVSWSKLLQYKPANAREDLHGHERQTECTSLANQSKRVPCSHTGRQRGTNTMITRLLSFFNLSTQTCYSFVKKMLKHLQESWCRNCTC